MARLILLDRDGVINQDSPDYVKHVDEWHEIPGSLEAIARLKRAGLMVAVCSNQSGLARGLFGADALNDIHRELAARLARRGARLDGLRVCPHGPDEGCRCRKPRPGMLLDTLEDLSVPAAEALFVGDSARDQAAAAAAGCGFALVLTGNGAGHAAAAQAAGAVWVGPDLAAFADWLLGDRDT